VIIKVEGDKKIFTKKCQLINAEEMIELEKHSLTIPNDQFRQKSLMDTKTMRQKVVGE